MPSSRRLLVALLLVSGCAAPARVAEPPPAAPAARPHENLHSVLWTQTSVEFRAVAEQAYRQAALMLERALADPSWTASVEQSAAGGYEALPPAVVLDVDETVLDNSPYQARLVRDAAAYTPEGWKAWVLEARAAPVPGARAFTQQAAARGVTVVYLTNRRADEEDATRRNLSAYGFPLSDAYDVVLTRGERPEWRSGEKEARRRDVAARYRILLLVGDNLGDFVAGVEQSVEARDALVAPYDAYWGTRWIMLPNPQYGSWEGALFDHDNTLPGDARLRRKYDRLDVEGRPLPAH